MDEIYRALMQMAVIVNRDQNTVLQVTVTESGCVANLLPAGLWYELCRPSDDENDDNEFE